MANVKFNDGDNQDFEKFYGMRIEKASFDGGSILLDMGNDIVIEIYDDRQSCCEKRYLNVHSDELQTLGGDTLRSIGVKWTTQKDDAGDYHEVAFCEIRTEDNTVSFSTHNEHNGYYGGFDLRVEVLQHGEPMEQEKEEVTPEQNRFPEIFSTIKTRGFEIREELFQAVEARNFGVLKNLADELFALDFVAKQAQLANAKAIEEKAKADFASTLAKK